MSHTFFFSYANDDLKDEQFLQDFFDQLRREVARYAGESLEQAAFRDLEDLRVGMDWTNKLAHELNHCRSFVYLSSPTYYSRPMCGQEFTYFRKRGAENAVETGMVPVIWIPHGDLPPAVKSIHSHRRHGVLNEDYAKLGLRYMMAEKMNYWPIINALAQEICRVAKLTRLTVNPEAFDGELKTNPFQQPVSAFRKTTGAGPAAGPGRKLKFVFVVGTPEELTALRADLSGYEDGEDWQPFFPPHQELASTAAQNTAMAEEVGRILKRTPEYERIAFDEDFIAKVRDAERKNSIVILLVDCWSLNIDRIMRLMKQFDELHFINCEVIIPVNGLDPELTARHQNLDELIDEAFFHKDESTLWRGITGPTELRAALIDAVKRRQDHIIKRTKYVRAIPAAGPSSLPRL